MSATDDLERLMRKVAFATPAAALEAGHGRRAWDDDTHETAARVPIIGVDAGCIPGTMPGGAGCTARELERAGRDLVRARLSRRRFKPA